MITRDDKADGWVHFHFLLLLLLLLLLFATLSLAALHHRYRLSLIRRPESEIGKSQSCVLMDRLGIDKLGTTCIPWKNLNRTICYSPRRPFQFPRQPSYRRQPRHSQLRFSSTLDDDLATLFYDSTTFSRSHPLDRLETERQDAQGFT